MHLNGDKKLYKIDDEGISAISDIFDWISELHGKHYQEMIEAIL